MSRKTTKQNIEEIEVIPEIFSETIEESELICTSCDGTGLTNNREIICSACNGLGK